MHHLEGHPNVVALKGSYEDKHHVHLVMEVGGQDWGLGWGVWAMGTHTLAYRFPPGAPLNPTRPL